MSLDQYTDQQLMDELLNRRLEREKGREEIQQCEECSHFKCWTRRGDVPDTYNPCTMGHQMAFRTPEDWEDPHDFGYYRRICSDRQQVEPPRPLSRPWPA